LLTYMLDIVHLMAHLPSVLIHRSISLPYMLAIYGLVLLMLVAAYRKLPKQKALISDETLQITP
jgi:hypothetical protein